MAHETHFTDGTEITPYLATAFAEGFCEGEDATPHDIIAARSYLQGTGLVNSLQGMFGRANQILIDNNHMALDGTIDWKSLESYLEEEDFTLQVDLVDDPNDEQTDDESYTNMEEL